MTEKQISLGDLLFNLMKIKDYYQSELNKSNKELSRYIKDLEKRKEKKIEIDINQTEIDTKDFWKKAAMAKIFNQRIIRTGGNPPGFRMRP